MVLKFSVSELESEIESAQAVMSKFLSAEAAAVLKRSSAALRTIATRGAGAYRWTIPEDSPVRTIQSKGQYMRGGGGLEVFGELSFVWELEPLRRSGTSRPAAEVQLAGLASTQIRIMRGDPYLAHDAREIAMWRMEVGDVASPGTHFHVQVLGRSADPPFPKSLDVPRLPGLMATPFSALEFLVSELFQSEWAEESIKGGGAMKRWRGVQATRIERQLEWHIEQVRDSTASPWMAVKMSKPNKDLFLV